MPLIKCPDCGKDVSTAAESCPTCGYPVRQSLLDGKHEAVELATSQPDVVVDSKEAQTSKKFRGLMLLGVIVVVLLLIAGGLINEQLRSASTFGAEAATVQTREAERGLASDKTQGDTSIRAANDNQGSAGSISDFDVVLGASHSKFERLCADEGGRFSVDASMWNCEKKTSAQNIVYSCTEKEGRCYVWHLATDSSGLAKLLREHLYEHGPHDETQRGDCDRRIWILPKTIRAYSDCGTYWTFNVTRR
jgi:hypothetical protein